jgi:signal peptidase II
MGQRIKHLLLFIILVVIDQLTKYWVRTDLINRNPIDIIPGVLNLQHTTNNGAVWGIMSGKVPFLIVFTTIVMVLILFLYFKIPQAKKYNVLKLLVVFIMAGAIGNFIDRIFLGHVIDFIYFELINFPLFNVADSYLTVSSILLFILAIFYYKDDDFAFLEQLFKKKKAAADANTEDAKDDSSDSK